MMLENFMMGSLLQQKFILSIKGVVVVGVGVNYEYTQSHQEERMRKLL